MHQTLNFLNIIDSKIKHDRNKTAKSHSVKDKIYLKRNSRLPYAKAIDFNETQYADFPKWLTQKEGFIDFMYKNYEQKLMSIPKICEKSNRASDEKYFVSLYLDQIPFFQELPQVVNDIILSNITTRYYKAGDLIYHEDNIPQFMAVVFVGAVQFKSNKKVITREKNCVILSDAFYGHKHESIYCKQQAILLTLDCKIYSLIINRLREDIEIKERDEISDMLKSTFFSELHIKDKKSRHFYNQCELKFYFKGQVVEEAGSDVRYFYILFRGQIQQENHIYIRQHNKWPLPHRKWEVRAVYNSFNKSNKMQKYDFFGDEEIITNSKLKSKYVTSSWAIIYALPAEKFIEILSSQDIKRLKKYRSEHVDLNYGQFQKNIREKMRSLSENKNIIAKAINTSLAHKSAFSPKRMTLINNFQKSMLNKTFFNQSIKYS